MKSQCHALRKDYEGLSTPHEACVDINSRIWLSDGSVLFCIDIENSSNELQKKYCTALKIREQCPVSCGLCEQQRSLKSCLDTENEFKLPKQAGKSKCEIINLHYCKWPRIREHCPARCGDCTPGSQQNIVTTPPSSTPASVYAIKREQNFKGPSKINTHSPSNPPTNTINDVPSLSPSNKVSIAPTISQSSDPTITLSTTPCVDKEGFIEMGLVQGIVIEKTCEWLATKVSISTRKKKCKKWPKVNSHCYMTCSGCLYSKAPTLLIVRIPSILPTIASSPIRIFSPFNEQSKLPSFSPSSVLTYSLSKVPTRTFSESQTPLSTLALLCKDKKGTIGNSKITCDWLATKATKSFKNSRCKNWPEVKVHCYMTCSGCVPTESSSQIPSYKSNKSLIPTLGSRAVSSLPSFSTASPSKVSTNMVPLRLCKDNDGTIVMGKINGDLIIATCDWLASKASLLIKNNRCEKWPEVKDHCYRTCSGCIVLPDLSTNLPSVIHTYYPTETMSNSPSDIVLPTTVLPSSSSTSPKLCNDMNGSIFMGILELEKKPQTHDCQWLSTSAPNGFMNQRCKRWKTVRTHCCKTCSIVQEPNHHSPNVLPTKTPTLIPSYNPTSSFSKISSHSASELPSLSPSKENSKSSTKPFNNVTVIATAIICEDKQSLVNMKVQGKDELKTCVWLALQSQKFIQKKCQKLQKINVHCYKTCSNCEVLTNSPSILITELPTRYSSEIPSITPYRESNILSLSLNLGFFF